MALRTVFILDYIERSKMGADAWLLNFTNPGFVEPSRASAVLNELLAFRQYRHDARGSRLSPRRGGRSVPEYYGINHLGWMRALYLNGRNVVPRSFN